jgi:hypothetical protein
MLIPVGFAQINAIHTGSALPFGAQWTLGVDITALAFTPTEVAQQFEAALLASNLYDSVAQNVTLTSVLVKFGPNATGESTLEPANEPGTVGTAASPNTAYLIHKNTAAGGRAGRGRFFLPGVSDAKIEPNGTLASGIASDLNTALNIFHAELVAGDLPPVLLHAEGSPISTPTPITSFSCDTRAATQRRRLRR